VLNPPNTPATSSEGNPATSLSIKHPVNVPCRGVAPLVGFFAEKSRTCAVASNNDTTMGLYSTSDPPPANTSSQSFTSDHDGRFSINQQFTITGLVLTACPNFTADAFTKLNQELMFIQECDEHADVAAGARSVDESLVDEIIESSKDIATAAQKETQALEAQENSCHSQQLHAVL
jgi:hypothetical protein